MACLPQTMFLKKNPLDDVVVRWSSTPDERSTGTLSRYDEGLTEAPRFVARPGNDEGMRFWHRTPFGIGGSVGLGQRL